MKTKNVAVLGVVGTLLAGTAAWAGFKNYSAVYIDPNHQNASGSVGDARASADSNQFIGCAVTGYANGGGMSILCQARDADNNNVYCYSEDPDLVRAASTQTSASYLYFIWDHSGTCTYLYVNNSSSYAPRQP